MEAVKGMRVIPTRSQSAKEMLYLFIQVGVIYFMLFRSGDGDLQ